jgi:hypothetical protein
MLDRLKASFILTPAILLLLCWIARFAAPEEVVRIGIAPFVLWAAAVSFVMAYLVTLYISFVAQKLLRR